MCCCINFVGLSAPDMIQVTAIYDLQTEIIGLEIEWRQIVRIRLTYDYSYILTTHTLASNSEHAPLIS